jgi:hypothetical protein
MGATNSERVFSIVFPVAKRISLIFVAWVVSIVGCIYAAGNMRFILIFVYYALSVSLYFFAVQFDDAMQNAGHNVRHQTKAHSGLQPI